MKYFGVEKPIRLSLKLLDPITFKIIETIEGVSIFHEGKGANIRIAKHPLCIECRIKIQVSSECKSIVEVSIKSTL